MSKMKRKFPSKENKEKVEVIQTTFTGEPRPDKDEGLESFIKQHIKFKKNLRRTQFADKKKFKKQHYSLKQNISALEIILYYWDKVKPR